MRHVVVTGAASGIGREIAHTFASAGDRVSVVDIDRVRLERVTAELRELGATVKMVVADLCEATAANEVIESTWSAAPVDVLVASAGIYPATPFLTLTADVWDRVQNLNTRSPLLLTVELARRAIAESRTPSVVAISSGAALRARPGAAPYSTSKAALDAAMRAAAVELGPHGIRVNVVSPGFVTVNSTTNPVTERYADAVSKNPIGRRGEPRDIASAVSWLASPGASWVTGSVIRVDGGASAGTTELPQHWPNTHLTNSDEVSDNR